VSRECPAAPPAGLSHRAAGMMISASRARVIARGPWQTAADLGYQAWAPGRRRRAEIRCQALAGSRTARSMARRVPMPVGEPVGLGDGRGRTPSPCPGDGLAQARVGAP